PSSSDTTANEDDQNCVEPTETGSGGATAATDAGGEGGPDPRASGGSARLPRPPIRARNILHISLTELLDLHENGTPEPAILGELPSGDHRRRPTRPRPPSRQPRRRIRHRRHPPPIRQTTPTPPRQPATVPRPHRDAINTLRQACTRPSGCTRPADTCTTDHSHDYARGGGTSVDNGNPLCDTHHRAKTNNE